MAVLIEQSMQIKNFLLYSLISAFGADNAYSHRKLNLAMLELSLKYLCKKLVNQTIPGKKSLNSGYYRSRVFKPTTI
jgi:hypothetical protein